MERLVEALISSILQRGQEMLFIENGPKNGDSRKSSEVQQERDVAGDRREPIPDLSFKKTLDNVYIL